MKLPISTDYAPMEAETAREIPRGEQWQYEPKWDGFRCLAFRDKEEIELISKSGQGLGRYFPEMIAALSVLKARQFVLDGELIIADQKRLDFDALLQRIHPAASRIKKLAVQTPATFLLFDLLVDDRAKSIADQNLKDRRDTLERFAAKYLGGICEFVFRLAPMISIWPRVGSSEWPDRSTASSQSGLTAPMPPASEARC